MHKKYNKFTPKDHHHISTSRKGKSRKENEDSALELIKVPQNSRSELNKKLDYGNYEIKQASKSNKEKRTHTKEQQQLEEHNKDKHKKKVVRNISDVEGLVALDDTVRHKERKEKRDKERMNKIEKYLEGLNKNRKKLTRNRSLSLRSSESADKNQERRLRKEKTFHNKLTRGSSTNISDAKPCTKEKKSEKRKHKESRDRESSKEKNTRDNDKEVMYCEVELQNPLLQGKKKYNLERLYPVSTTNKEKSSSRKRSSSRDSFNPKLETSKTHREKKTVPVKFSPRKSKLKTDLKNYKEQRSNGSLGPYGKYFIFDKDTNRNKKKRHKLSRNEQSNEPKSKNTTEKRKERDRSNQDQYKEKIEDDIKSYFTKIQTLIDKKLDFILGNNNSKRTKTNPDTKEEGKKRKSKKEKTPESNKPKRKKNNDKEKREKRPIEDVKIKRSEEKKRSLRESRLTNDTRASSTSLRRETYPSEESKVHERRRSPKKQRQYQDNPSVSHIIEMLESNKDTAHHKRHLSPYFQPNEKLRPEDLICMVEHPSKFSIPSNTSVTKEKCVDEVKRRPKLHAGPAGNGRHSKREKNSPGRNAVTAEDSLQAAESEMVYVHDAHTKKMRKRMKQLMNLECKTVSIVGIPSQLRESTIFNQTQTTTSLNALNPTEDSVEKKKKSKRFKLYYKYSVAENKCSPESDKSSEGKKSIISDSYRIVSDPSDRNIDVWKDSEGQSNNGNEDTDELKNILCIMNNEKLQKNCGDQVSSKHTNKFRKQTGNSKHVTLNNILEEPSNISIVVHHKETPPCLDTDMDCTFFKTLKSSSSECNLQLMKKSRQKEWIVPAAHHIQNFNDTVIRSKSPSGKEGHQCEGKPEERFKCEEIFRNHKKLRKMESHHKIRKKHFKCMDKYTSKSDINVSYDSLTKFSFNKKRHNCDITNFLREQLKQLLPDISIRTPRKESPDMKNINMTLEEELRAIIREIPRLAVAKKASVDELGETKKAKSRYVDKEVANSIEELSKPADKNHTLEAEEKKYHSKKTGTHQAATKIPSLVKGYCVIQPSQNIKEIKTETAEKNLVDLGVETEVNGNKQYAPEKAEITLENRKSQTPKKFDAEIALSESSKQQSSPSKHAKKATTIDNNNVKRCQIVDPFKETKIGCMTKPTRPIINLENTHFPNRKLQCSSGSNRPTSLERTDRGKLQKNVSKKLLERRPATAEESKHITVDEFKRKSIKPTLTISTNIITVRTPIYTENCTETFKEDTAENSNQTDKREKRAKSTSSEKKRPPILKSKSTLSLNDVSMESTMSSLVSIEKFNTQKINFRPDSTLCDNPHTSRLFLTKNFSPELNTYQRRKMYDENIRKKMKKRISSQNQMGPRIYEVRYLTLESQETDTRTISKPANPKFVNKLPTFNTKLNKVRQRTKTSRVSSKKSKKTLYRNKEDACKFSGRDIFAPVITDVDQLNRFRRKLFPEKKIEEIFVNEDASDQKEDQSDKAHSSALVLNEDGSNAEHLKSRKSEKSNKIDFQRADQNFKELIDSLYDSIISYCNTKFKLPEEGSMIAESIEDKAKMLPCKEKSYVILQEASNQNEATTNSLKNDPLSEVDVNGGEKQLKDAASLVCNHLSCPVLAGSSSSFDYLYEDGLMDINKDAVLLHFRKPVNTILGYTFNARRFHKEALSNLSKKDDQISNVATESEESGYSSNNSKKCASVCSFFKKPSIANLFKPVKKFDQQSSSSIEDCRSGPNMQEYNVMNQKCMEYAEKVRIQTKNKHSKEEIFEEIPLNVLLLCRKSSTLLNEFNSSCSLCQKQSNLDLPDIVEGEENVDHLLRSNDDCNEKNINKKPLVQGDIPMTFYDDVNHIPSLEKISLQKHQLNFTNDDKSQLIEEMVQCPVVLSLTNLNTCSLTIAEGSDTDTNIDYCFGDNHNIKHVEDVESNHIADVNYCSSTNLKSLPQADLDGRSEVSSVFGFRNVNSPSTTSKYMAKKFFENLLKVYEKEINVTDKLFRDDNFFYNVLLESVKSEEALKSKNTNFKKLIKGKIRNIGNVFFKNYPGSQTEPEDVQVPDNSGSNHQRKLQILASDARKYFSMFVQAVKTNKDINDEMKICGLLKLLERIENGDFAILRKQEEVDFEEEIKEQVKEAFTNIYQISVKEAKKRKRCLTTDDLKLIRTFVSKYRIGLLSRTDLIATYIGRGAFKTEGHLKAAVTYLIKQSKNRDVDLKDFDEHCEILAKCSV